MEDQDNGLACKLVFTYTEKYPDTAPLVEIEDPVDFEDDYETRLLEHIKETVSIFGVYNIGSAFKVLSVGVGIIIGYLISIFIRKLFSDQ